MVIKFVCSCLISELNLVGVCYKVYALAETQLFLHFDMLAFLATHTTHSLDCFFFLAHVSFIEDIRHNDLTQPSISHIMFN
jgi:hypothetical protein